MADHRSTDTPWFALPQGKLAQTSGKAVQPLAPDATAIKPGSSCGLTTEVFRHVIPARWSRLHKRSGAAVFGLRKPLEALFSRVTAPRVHIFSICLIGLPGISRSQTDAWVRYPFAATQLPRIGMIWRGRS